MMKITLFGLLILLLNNYASGFKRFSPGITLSVSRKAGLTLTRLSDSSSSNARLLPEYYVSYERVAVSGLVNQATDIAETSVFSILYEEEACKHIRCLCDDFKFARKRFTTPRAVQSALWDKLELREVTLNSESLEQSTRLAQYQDALTDCDGWLAFNVTADALDFHLTVAEKLKPASLARAVFAVPVGDEEDEATVDRALAIATERLAMSPWLRYTLFKYDKAFTPGVPEAKHPYRITQGLAPIGRPHPSLKDSQLASGDLFRVLADSVDYARTFNSTYGIGAGAQIDAELMVHMKGRGWSQRVQAGVLLDCVRDKIFPNGGDTAELQAALSDSGSDRDDDEDK